MLEMPALAYFSRMPAISSSLWQTHVRCGTGSSLVWLLRRRTRLLVASRVVPPAPYVTDTNCGARGSSSLIALKSESAASGFLGGKNSKEKVVACLAKMSLMCIGGGLGGRGAEA